MTDATRVDDLAHAGDAISYREALDVYSAADWGSILPLPFGKKDPPPAGFTGTEGRAPSEVDYSRFLVEHPGPANVCIRLPRDVVGIDIDTYGTYDGDSTIAGMEAEHGPLPDTWCSTSRLGGPRSGIWWYRIPAGTRLREGFPGVQLIQHHHRYALVWPSVHPSGRRYQWVGPGGELAEPGRVPSPDELADLPWSWLEALRDVNGPAAPADYGPAERRDEANWSPAVVRAYEDGIADIRSGRSRHESGRDTAMRLARLEQLGCAGASAALDEFGAVFVGRFPIVRGDDRADQAAARLEWDKLAASARHRAATTESRLLRSQSSEHSEPSKPGDDTGSEGSEGFVQWEEPVPLGRAVELPTFPVEALPDHAAAYVEATAEATQTPVDLAGCVVLAAHAAALTGRAHVRVREGHIEPTQLYVCPVMAPGERKSPVFTAATAPLVDAERDLVETTLPKIRDALAEREVAEGRAQAAKQRAIKAKPGKDLDDARKAALDAAREADEIEVPSVPRLICDDATPEALASLLADQGGRMAVFSDEGGGLFDIMAGRYSSTGRANLDIYLKGHTGSPHRVDRKGRAPEHIPAPAVTLGLTMQPAVLEDIGRNPTMRGRGLFGRFLFAVPRSLVGRRRIGTAPVPAHVRDAYAATLTGLVHRMWPLPDPVVLDLAPDALAVFEAFEAELEPRLVGDLDDIRDWATKLAGQVARIAGVLHLAARRGAAEPIPATTMQAAVELGRYFLAHAQAAFDVMGASEAMRDARRIAEWITNQVEGDSFTKRDAHQKFRSSMNLEQVDAALEILEAHHWIALRPQPKNPKGGRPSKRFEINPHHRRTP